MALRSVRTRVELLAGRADQLGPAIINSPAAMSSSPAVGGATQGGEANDETRPTSVPAVRGRFARSRGVWIVGVMGGAQLDVRQRLHGRLRAACASWAVGVCRPQHRTRLPDKLDQRMITQIQKAK
jgi:hypothetical protein